MPSIALHDGIAARIKVTGRGFACSIHTESARESKTGFSLAKYVTEVCNNLKHANECMKISMGPGSASMPSKVPYLYAYMT